MILVTGGTGFLGSYIIQQLVEQGYNVRAIKRNSSRLPFYISADILNKVEWVDGDVLDVFSLDDAMKGIDIVIHAAAIVSFHQSDKLLMTQTNVDGTANVVNLALENNIRRFIHISSVAALGRTKNGEIVTEKKEWTENNINTAYAISKHKAEMEVWRGIGEGMDAVILNPSTILGFGDWNHSSCAIFKTGYNEFGYYTEGVNGFVDVTDVAKAVVLLMQSTVSAERFIISSENWSFKKLLDSIADGFQKKKPNTLATPFIGAIAWRLEKIKALFKNGKPMLTQESAKVAQSKTFFDNSKILAALPNFQFSSLEKTITESCAKYNHAAYTTR